jgi:hypothetical protein
MYVFAKSAIRVPGTVRVEMQNLDGAPEDEQKCEESNEKKTSLRIRRPFSVAQGHNYHDYIPERQNCQNGGVVQLAVRFKLTLPIFRRTKSGGPEFGPERRTPAVNIFGRRLGHPISGLHSPPNGQHATHTSFVSRQGMTFDPQLNSRFSAIFCRGFF